MMALFLLPAKRIPLKWPNFNTRLKFYGLAATFVTGMWAGYFLNDQDTPSPSAEIITRNDSLDDKIKALQDATAEFEEELQKPYDPNNQIFEAASLSIHRGIAIEENDSGFFVCAHDTVDVFLGFNPAGLKAYYRYANNYAFAETDSRLLIGRNALVFHTDHEFFRARTDTSQAMTYFKAKYDVLHAYQDDKLYFITPASYDFNEWDAEKQWAPKAVLQVPMGVDTSFVETLQPDKPVLVAFFSKSQRAGRKQSGQQNVALAKRAYGDSNVLVVDEPTDEKINVLSDIFQRRYPNTRVDFCTMLDHREGRSTKEYRVFEPYSGRYVIPKDESLYITDERVAGWMKQFPGNDKNKRLMVLECSAGNIMHDTKNPLRSFGLVIAPSPSKTYNISSEHGSYGKEVLFDMRKFDFNKPFGPQRKNIKEKLRVTYDMPISEMVRNGMWMPIGSVKELRPVLANDSNRIYINGESITAPDTTVKSDVKRQNSGPTL